MFNLITIPFFFFFQLLLTSMSFYFFSLKKKKKKKEAVQASRYHGATSKQGRFRGDTFFVFTGPVNVPLQICQSIKKGAV